MISGQDMNIITLGNLNLDESYNEVALDVTVITDFIINSVENGTLLGRGNYTMKTKVISRFKNMAFLLTKYYFKQFLIHGHFLMFNVKTKTKF